MNLSIIIVSWNTRDLLRRCLASLYANLPEGETEVLVVDNVSTDGTVEMVRAEFPLVRLLDNTENVGFARGNNQALRLRRGRHILLLNPDTEVHPGALQALVCFLDEHPEVGAVGPRLLNPDGSLQVSCYPAPTLTREAWRLFHLDRLRPYGIYPVSTWRLDQPREVDVLMGACLLLRGETLNQVGLLDEGYFIYTEEVDLCLRVQRAGWWLAWLPQARVVHYGGQSTRQVAQSMFLHLYHSKVLYFRKHYGPAAARVYKLILFASSLPRLLLAPLAFIEPPARRADHLRLSGNYARLVASLPRM